MLAVLYKTSVSLLTIFQHQTKWWSYKQPYRQEVKCRFWKTSKRTHIVENNEKKTLHMVWITAEISEEVLACSSLSGQNTLCKWIHLFHLLFLQHDLPPEKKWLLHPKVVQEPRFPFLWGFFKLSEHHLFWNEQNIETSKFTRECSKEIISGHFSCFLLKRKKPHVLPFYSNSALSILIWIQKYFKIGMFCSKETLLKTSTFSENNFIIKGKWFLQNK